MVETLALLIPICALSLVCVGLLVVAAVVGVRFLGFNMPDWLGPLGNFLDGEEDEITVVTQSTRRRRTSLRDQPLDLDFDAAVARHANDKFRDIEERPDPDVPENQFNAKSFDVDVSSPISGRIMRDGRYRRITSNEPGREKDQDFRRVEAGDDDVIPPLRRRRRRRDRYSDDEIHGGLLDEDGDGDVDF